MNNQLPAVGSNQQSKIIDQQLLSGV